MTAANNYEGVKHVTYISTDVGRGCEHCDQAIGCYPGNDPGLAESINHYIEKHGYRLLHVGTETSHDDQGKPWHSTVAVLGTDNPPPPRPRTELKDFARERS